jgi:AmmeMemoRadiSam system protein A
VQGVKPLVHTLNDMAQAAAFSDPRFAPLTAAEYADADIEISIMGPISPCPGPEEIVIGRHGLILRKNRRSGLLLPQVPVEWGWDVPTFLEQLCRKAGLPPGAWKDREAQLYWFEAVCFDLPEKTRLP